MKQRRNISADSPSGSAEGTLPAPNSAGASSQAGSLERRTGKSACVTPDSAGAESEARPQVATGLMIVAGERSGDIFGAGLAAALRARLGQVAIFGCGGEEMRRAGVETVVDLSEFAMVGITEVVSRLPRAYLASRRLMEEARRRHPAMAILIDSPSLNIRLAPRLKRLGVPVTYFVSPQVWAWKKWRLRQLKTRIDKMICIFDFEEEMYRREGIPVEYVGHPLVDEVHPTRARAAFFAKVGLEPGVTTVALLPGSRRSEVQLILPTLLEAAVELAGARRLQFVVAVAPTIEEAWLEAEYLAPYRRRMVRITGITGATRDALYHADLAVVASGTATIEAALLERPMAVVYRVSRVTALLARALGLRLPFYSMVNLLAGRSAVPELIQEDFTAGRVASEVARLLDDAGARARMVNDLRDVKVRLGSAGALDRAADVIARSIADGRDCRK
ncbi:MAG TPA: lipid-A-disaccharide synthase [Terriglobia bacterium]|nr:lipid-A-disaccharide synthase [Terriglobia bacterium]